MQPPQTDRKIKWQLYRDGIFYVDVVMAFSLQIANLIGKKE
jgi:hypothetical protein